MKLNDFRSRSRLFRMRMVSFALLSALVATPALAMERGRTPTGVRYVSGGIGIGEIQKLHAEKGHYNLWVTTVARGSGAYLANAHARIVPAEGGGAVLDVFMDGPWLLVDLPPGHYKVWVSTKHEISGAPLTHEERVQVDSNGLRQVVARFATPVEAAPDQPKLFDGNPFGGSSTR